MEELLVSLACQLIVSKTELKIVVQKTQNYPECHYTSSNGTVKPIPHRLFLSTCNTALRKRLSYSSCSWSKDNKCA